MVFSSIPFLFYFFPLFFILYYLVPKQGKNLWILIASLIFYAWGEPVYILILLLSSLVDYMNGRMIERYEGNRKVQKRFLILSIVVNLGLMGIFKYGNLFVETINKIIHGSIPAPNLALPIGISFFTFQTMSYSMDVYRKEVKAEHNFIHYMAYVSMFPQLVAGPIVRYETISRELKERTLCFEEISKGFIRFLQGLFKKVLIANQVGALWSILSQDIEHLSVLGAWLGIVAFTLQIYFDFSGYSDMAIGMGQMMGFHYLENFNYPYIACSITEFWRRWHISLSGWFRDYVYIPLGGNRCKPWRHIINLLLVWGLTGFWHGASWNYLLWGLYYAILLILEKYVFASLLEKIPGILCHVYTMFFVIIGWMIFVFEDFRQLLPFVKALLGFGHAWINQNTLYLLGNYGLILLIGIVLSTPITVRLKQTVQKWHLEKPVSVLCMFSIIVLFLVVTAQLILDTYNPFLYFRF